MLQMKKINNLTEHILHVPGNYSGKTLEMTIVIDHAIDMNKIKTVLPQMITGWKRHSSVFRNVRLNITDWYSDSRMENRVCPMMNMVLASAYENTQIDSEQEIANEKRLDLLSAYLKMYHARSKLIVILMGEKIVSGDYGKLELAMKPFLTRKIIGISLTDDQDMLIQTAEQILSQRTL